MNNWPISIICLFLMLGLSACTDPTSDNPVSNQTVDDSLAIEEGPCEHKLPPALCTKCNPALSAVFRAKGDWCEIHGFPESFCPLCNPHAAIPKLGDTAQPVTDWCAGHRLPESKCTKCNPSLVATFREAGDFCATHGFPESICPICNPQKPPANVAQAAIETRVVRFRSPEIEQAAGIQTATAKRNQLTSTITCTARVAFDTNRVADVRAIVPGIVRRIEATLGEQVERGAPLFVLESTRVGEIQGALLAARERLRAAQTNLTRQRELRNKNIASAREVELAEKELASASAETRTAEATLRMAGAKKSTPSGRYTLSAPINGTVVRRSAVVGLLATESESLATIADTSVMWILCDVPEAHASKLALGQKMVITSENNPHGSVEGQLTWIAAEVDPRMRTVTARAEVPNPQGLLRANQFMRAHIQTNAPQTAVSVPRSAVQRVDEYEVVFVRTSPGTYSPRIILRHGDDEYVQVEGRVQAGDQVATTGAVLLRTEIMPDSIGAGCCEVKPPEDQ